MSHTSIPIPDRLLISGPNDGGLAILHGQRCLHLLTESATGIGIDGEQVAWCPQRDGVAGALSKYAMAGSMSSLAGTIWTCIDCCRHRKACMLSPRPRSILQLA